MNFKFRFNSKIKQFSSRHNPFLKVWRRKIRAFHSPSGKAPSWQTIGGVLTLHRCRSWARHALCAQDEPCKQGTAGRDTRAVLLFPTNVPMELPAALPGFAAAARRGRSTRAASPGSGPCPHRAPSRGIRHSCGSPLYQIHGSVIVALSVDPLFLNNLTIVILTKIWFSSRVWLLVLQIVFLLHSVFLFS